MKLRVVIADDEPLARERLRGFLESEPDVEIVGECADGMEAVRQIQDATARTQNSNRFVSSQVVPSAIR